MISYQSLLLSTIVLNDIHNFNACSIVTVSSADINYRDIHCHDYHDMKFWRFLGPVDMCPNY